MDGILNILKPTGMTSHDVVGYVRKHFSIKKVGHTGTLDPNAAGVLPLCLGKATKLSQYLMEKDKAYRCQLIFGQTTDTLDSYGTVLEDLTDEIEQSSHTVIPTEKEIQQILETFEGETMQTPPSYSAIKINGVKLYEKARKGQTIGDIPSRKVTIHNIELMDYDYPRLTIDVECSKGTYIRSLVRDLAQALGTKAYMSLLIRTRAGQFDLDKTCSLQELDSDGLTPHIVKMEEVIFPGMTDISLKESAEKSYINGSIVSEKGLLSKLVYSENTVRVFGENGKFLGIGKIVEKNTILYLKSDTLLI